MLSKAFVDYLPTNKTKLDKIGNTRKALPTLSGFS
jgi:hypothetical protein